ncbi:hypothetical protein [Actinokineospora bangkokensis]|uniref:hypothetical protein n=1 Tax=Actinokineospora bangkokensis TaxID=1193682 RepID=UPI00117812A6|nr:hypothetical protein [Actinokineospora bangkokensis]
MFDIAGQRLVCPQCGNAQDVVENRGHSVVEHDFEGALRSARGLTGEVQEKEIVCQNCGGHTTFSGSLTASRCPYCATPIQRDDVQDAPGRVGVDAVLPFRVDERAGRELVERWIGSRWFAPSEFTRYKETGAFSSVYLAYFSYDARADSEYDGERGRRYTVTVGSGKQRRTQTRVDWTPVRGRVVNAFDDLPVLANTGVDVEKVAALEPWPTHEARPFSHEYLAGHLSRTYDVGVAEAFELAKGRMAGVVEAAVRVDIGGDAQQVHRVDTRYSDVRFKHLLMPIWLLTVLHRGEPFQVCVNGVTGEVQGRRPVSAVKVVAAVVLAVVVLVGLYLLVQGIRGR